MLSGLIPRLFEELRAEGFALQGAVDLAEVDEAAWREHVARYDEWIAAGKHGEMQYLVRGRDRRADPRIVFPEAVSVVTVAFPYPAKPAGAADPRRGPRYAAYIRGGGDYHEIMKERMETALARFRDRHAGGLGAHLRWKVCVDTSAVLERSWGAFTGLGWIGKNSLLINPTRLGSYFFIGVAFLNLPTGRKPAPLPNYCGNCSACLEGCPTGAFDGPGRLDARRCTSYLTLEKRGPWTGVSPEVLTGMGAWVAGCDICQEVCPFNRKRRAADAGLELDDGPAAPADWESLRSETEEQYKTRVKGTALSRIKPADFARNLQNARANANSGARGPT